MPQEHTKSPNPPSFERQALFASAAGLLSMVWIHALTAVADWAYAVLGGAVDAGSVSTPAWALTLAALVTGSVAGMTRNLPVGLSAAVSSSAMLWSVGVGSVAGSLALLLAAVALATLTAVAQRHLPAHFGIALDGSARRRPMATAAVAALVLLALLQVARLSTFMADPASDWFLTTRNPFWAKHGCMTAYLHAAELAERGAENVYDAAHYPGLNPQATPSTDMHGMAVEDPFQYPPQFLLLPALARAFSHDFLAVQTFWFALQSTLFLAVSLALALWIGGREGRRSALLLPLAVSAFPLLHALQYGQFHLAAVVLAAAAMLAFELRRTAVGGAFLAVAISAKLFPGLLLVVLAVQRRWRALAWTAGFGVGFALLGLAVLGPAPYTAFFDYHLPRLVGGEAFAFGDAWPEIQDLIVADNQGAHGIVLKLQAMGLSFLGDGAARWATKLFALCALLLTAFFARREAGTPRHLRVAGWLAILGLGSMTSPGAFGDYVPLTATWLLIFVAGAYARGLRWALPLTACWIFHYTLLGTAPLGAWFDPAVMMPVSLIGALLMFGLFASVLGGLFADQTVPTPADARKESEVDGAAVDGAGVQGVPAAARSLVS